MEIASAPDADNYYNQYPIVSARTFFGVLGGVFVFLAIIACICDRYGPPQRGINNDPPSTLSRPPSSADDRHGAPIQIVIQRDALPLCTFRQLKGAAAASCCTICLGNYKDGEPVRVLPECCHVFHRSCIDPWLRIHATCPNCRNSTPSAAATQ